MNQPSLNSRFWPVALLAAVIGLPAYVGCRAAEEPKTPEEIEQIRIEHAETSRRELEG